MKLEVLAAEFVKAFHVIEQIEQHGFEAYFVGGSVRDALLGKESHDVDIATSAYPEEIKNIFKRTIDVGIEHGTVLALVGDEQYEITTFRTESTYQDYRRPDSVTFVRSLEEDLKRRDFTINALALKRDGTVVDLFGGLNDLEAGILRAVGDAKERFHEDALRMMRGLRFASQLDFQIDPETLNAIATYHSLLGKISVERIAIEFEKMLLGKKRSNGLRPFIELGCYESCPGLQAHKEGLLCFSQLPDQQIHEVAQAWALLLHQFGVTQQGIRPFLKEWKLSNQLIHEVTELIYGLTQRLAADWQRVDLYRLGVERALSVESLLSFYDMRGKLKETQQLYEALPIKQRQQLAVTGNDLLAVIDRKPGKWLGSLIDHLEIAVINSELANDKAILIEAAQTYLSAG